MGSIALPPIRNEKSDSFALWIDLIPLMWSLFVVPITFFFEKFQIPGESISSSIFFVLTGLSVFVAIQLAVIRGAFSKIGALEKRPATQGARAGGIVALVGGGSFIFTASLSYFDIRVDSTFSGAPLKTALTVMLTAPIVIFVSTLVTVIIGRSLRLTRAPFFWPLQAIMRPTGKWTKRFYRLILNLAMICFFVLPAVIGAEKLGLISLDGLRSKVAHIRQGIDEEKKRKGAEESNGFEKQTLQVPLQSDASNENSFVLNDDSGPQPETDDRTIETFLRLHIEGLVSKDLGQFLKNFPSSFSREIDSRFTITKVGANRIFERYHLSSSRLPPDPTPLKIEPVGSSGNIVVASIRWESGTSKIAKIWIKRNTKDFEIIGYYLTNEN